MAGRDAVVVSTLVARADLFHLLVSPLFHHHLFTVDLARSLAQRRLKPFLYRCAETIRPDFQLRDRRADGIV